MFDQACSIVNFSVSFAYYLLWSSQNLADLENSVHLTGARKQRSERVELSHDTAYGPLVYRRAVTCGLEKHFWSSVPKLMKQKLGVKRREMCVLCLRKCKFKKMLSVVQL